MHAFKCSAIALALLGIGFSASAAEVNMYGTYSVGAVYQQCTLLSAPPLHLPCLASDLVLPPPKLICTVHILLALFTKIFVIKTAETSR